MCDLSKSEIDANNHKILAALQYEPLFNISCSEKWVKKIQAAAYNGARTVYYRFDS